MKTGLRFGSAAGWGTLVLALIAVLTTLPASAPGWLREWTPALLAGLSVYKAFLSPSTHEGAATLAAEKENP